MSKDAADGRAKSVIEKSRAKKWKTIRVRQELVEAARTIIKTGKYQSLSEFVTDAIEQRLIESKQTALERPVERFRYPVVYERLLYSKNHMWAQVTPEGNMRIGLSNFAGNRLNGIQKIDVEPIGSSATREKPFGAIETWMFRFDLYTPTSGKIAKINERLKEKPFTLSEHQHVDRWIAEIKPNNIIILEEELRDLMSPREYKSWTRKHHFTHVTKTVEKSAP